MSEPLLRHVAGARGPTARDYDADIIILSLHRTEETLRAITSALAQNGVSKHVFVVDQGSAPEALARLAAWVEGREDATLVALDRNHGVPAGRNIATNLGHGRLIVAIDNDAEFPTPLVVAAMAGVFAADSSIAAIGCRIVRHDTGVDDLSSWGYPRRLLVRAGEVFEVATFVGAGHAIRRSAWDQVGGYDGALFFCWEELDLSLRLIDCGWRIVYRGDIEVRHRVSAEARWLWSDERWFYFVRNRLYIGRKYGASWLALAPRATGYCVRGLCNGFFAQTLRAVLTAVLMARNLPRAALSGDTRAYLHRTDGVHRGSLASRVRHGILAPLKAAV